MPEKTVKIVFGEGYAGNIRVMIGAEEIPNIRSVKLPEVEPGELPKIEITMLAPRLEIEDKTQRGVTEMEEVKVSLGGAAGGKGNSSVGKSAAGYAKKASSK
ncbi:MAG: hypothetical protein AAGF93_00155 [Cyanobacteria bacterium P01_H01_bin.105]